MPGGQPGVPVEGRAPGLVRPLLALRHVALHHEHPERSAGRPGPCGVAVERGEGRAARPHQTGGGGRGEHGAVRGRPDEGDAGGGDREAEADGVASPEGGIGGERGVDPRVAHLEPGEAREQHPPQPLDEHPQGRQPPQGGHGRRRPRAAPARCVRIQDARTCPGEECGIERERAGQRAGEGRRRAEPDRTILETLREPPEAHAEPRRRRRASRAGRRVRGPRAARPGTARPANPPRRGAGSRGRRRGTTARRPRGRLRPPRPANARRTSSGLSRPRPARPTGSPRRPAAPLRAASTPCRASPSPSCGPCGRPPRRGTAAAAAHGPEERGRGPARWVAMHGDGAGTAGCGNAAALRRGGEAERASPATRRPPPGTDARAADRPAGPRCEGRRRPAPRRAPAGSRTPSPRRRPRCRTPPRRTRPRIAG